MSAPNEPMQTRGEKVVSSVIYMVRFSVCEMHAIDVLDFKQRTVVKWVPPVGVIVCEKGMFGHYDLPCVGSSHRLPHHRKEI